MAILIGYSSFSGTQSVKELLDQAELLLTQIQSHPAVDSVSYISREEAEVILEKCPTVANVAPQNHWRFPGGNILKYRNRKFSNPTFNGTWPDLIEVRNTNNSNEIQVLLTT